MNVNGYKEIFFLKGENLNNFLKGMSALDKTTTHPCRLEVKDGILKVSALSFISGFRYWEKFHIFQSITKDLTFDKYISFDFTAYFAGIKYKPNMIVYFFYNEEKETFLIRKEDNCANEGETGTENVVFPIDTTGDYDEDFFSRFLVNINRETDVYKKDVKLKYYCLKNKESIGVFKKLLEFSLQKFFSSDYTREDPYCSVTYLDFQINDFEIYKSVNERGNFESRASIVESYPWDAEDIGNQSFSEHQIRFLLDVIKKRGIEKIMVQRGSDRAWLFTLTSNVSLIRDTLSDKTGVIHLIFTS